MEGEDYQAQRKMDLATGMVIGGVIGLGVAALMGSRYRDEVADKAKRKFDELVDGKTPAEVDTAVRRSVGKVLEDIAQSQKKLPRGRT